MLSFISKLQRKPEPVRKKIALFASASVTFLIVLFWLVGISTRDTETVAYNEEDIGPFQVLTEGIGSFIDDSAKAFGALKETFLIFSNQTASSSEEREPGAVSN
ncbi:MAG: hypothetical protein A2849_00075 [Candidatus Taylorbacteria bacterium RIFCSPHIGHO2_01_FULL_51_15]|uniref:Uncharacterized protein n=1 Tax=Candidatus Taylorbacteria bacterium RIFCSPHIGHO2_01_FULL_51_15 TaxID=1802304 RepID=A0A1G2MDX8_9BACT|nr:MAG: hypothetical protein A2849_00075 [Candidatus Taylorbacteria bacterium RIFCSPHIGHO2_01_FULL_51_15]